MIEVFLIVMICVAPDFTTCKRAVAIESPDPITCQLDRIPISGLWKIEIRDQGFPNWEVFTYCDLVSPKKDGRVG